METLLERLKPKFKKKLEEARLKDREMIDLIIIDLEKNNFVEGMMYGNVILIQRIFKTKFEKIFGLCSSPNKFFYNPKYYNLIKKSSFDYFRKS